jgi:hypothetical protein
MRPEGGYVLLMTHFGAGGGEAGEEWEWGI